jgi:hypothetical protein
MREVGLRIHSPLVKWSLPKFSSYRVCVELTLSCLALAERCHFIVCLPLHIERTRKQHTIAERFRTSFVGKMSLLGNARKGKSVRSLKDMERILSA